MMDLLTGDVGLVIFTAVGIVATAVSIVRDAKDQKARLVTVAEDASADLPRAA
jgi:F0F1-type ATP synthase assembly protein I